MGWNISELMKILHFVDVTVTLVLALCPDGEDSVLLPIATTFDEYLLFAMIMKLFAGIMSFNLHSAIKLAVLLRPSYR